MKKEKCCGRCINIPVSWSYGLPPKDKICPHAIYFVKNGQDTEMYVTDKDGNAELVGGGSGSSNITIYSLNNTISVNQSGNIFEVDIEQSILNAINSKVESVTGDYVDNTDPQNPVIDMSDLINQLDNIEDAILEHPNYQQPSANLTNATQTVEKGSDLSGITLNISYTQNDAGAATNYSLKRNGVQISTSQNNTENETNITSVIKYKGFVDYQDGPCKNNNLGNIDCTGQILSGTTQTPERKITPRLRVWYGPVSSLPTNSSEIRSISDKVWNNQNQVTLNTATTETLFVVAIPSADTSASSLSAQDTTNNVSLDYNYDSDVTLNLQNGTETYRIYKLSVDNPYPTNAQHKITL